MHKIIRFWISVHVNLFDKTTEIKANATKLNILLNIWLNCTSLHPSLLNEKLQPAIIRSFYEH